MFPRSYLLHHKQCQTDKAKTITKIFHSNTGSYQINIGWLSYSQKSIGQKRKIKNTTKCKKCPF